MNIFSSENGEEKTPNAMDNVLNAVRASIENQKRIIELLKAQTNHITQGIAAQTETIQSQSVTIQRQHESISRFQNDLLLKTQKNLIMELIGIADNLRSVLSAQEAQPDYNHLLADVRALSVWVEKSLETAAVRSFSDVENQPENFNPQRQELQADEPTENPEEDGRLVSKQCGYVWSMPWLIVNSEVQLQNVVRDNPQARTFQFVLRPELVAKKKFISPQSDNSNSND